MLCKYLSIIFNQKIDSMEQTKSGLLTEFEGTQKVYATIWERLLALLIDGLIIGVITFPINYFNETSFKSFSLFVIFAVVGMIYKPLLEFKYGATLGKMVMKISIVTTSFEPINLIQAILRNVFALVSNTYAIVLTFIIFSSPDFANVTTFTEYNALSVSFTSHWAIGIYGLIVLIDIICLLANNQKRSLHDRIGQTLVIKNSQK
jgi:uncharacterized RDD family membrane protein YckC